MKQTVEEAEMNFANYESNILDKLPFKVKNVVDYDNGLTRGFKAGAEWQAKQSPWISVKERLPKDFKPKLILLKDGKVRTALLDSNYYPHNNEFEIIYFWHWIGTVILVAVLASARLFDVYLGNKNNKKDL